jgi:tetratricopeptide (TPR) repeat protein
VGRQEQPLDPGAGPLPAFAHKLRELRYAAGNPGYRSLARRAGYSASALSAAASGRILPSLAVTLAYVGACDGDLDEWERRWTEVAARIETAPDPAPRQLPPDIYGFTGRESQLAELDALLDGAGSAPSAVVISAVAGTGGVGKTALAVHWAHRAAGRFPDGQLYVDLRGYDPDRPLDPAEALAGFLRALGVSGDQIPYDAAERAARFRTLVAERRMLLLLDNAHSPDQVRLLLPGTPSCCVVVTSRDSLAGLVARHGARRLDLDLLRADEAVALLRTLVGRRIDAEPAAAAVLAERCARLPLALRLAAEMATARPRSTVDDLVAGLADEHRRLDLLDADADGRTAVRAVFSWSYRRLPDPAARMFRLLGLVPGRDVERYAAAALAGLDLDRAGGLLDALVRAHLVERDAAGRLRMHDLLRAYAAELAGWEPPAVRRAALTRLFDHYLATASAAMDVLCADEHHQRPEVPRPDSVLPPVTEVPAARAWLETEQANLLASAAYAAGGGWPRYTATLAETLSYHLERGGHYTEALAVYGHALTAAREDGDRTAEGVAQHRIGTVLCHLGRHAESAAHYQQALAIRRATGDAAMVGRTLSNLGNLYQRWGRHAEAADHFRAALASQRAIGDRYGEAVVLCNLGDLYVAGGGLYREALEHYERALELCREIGDRSGEGTTLACIAYVLVRFGRHAQAAERAQAALEPLREVGDRYGECYALASLGLARAGSGYADEATGHATHALRLARSMTDRMAEFDALNALGLIALRAGRYTEALDQLRAALVLARTGGYRSREISALNGLGEAARATACPEEAAHHHTVALHLARELDNKDQQARALAGLAAAREAGGRPDEARDSWRAALRLYTDLGVPEAADVRARLASPPAWQETRSGTPARAAR